MQHRDLSRVAHITPRHRDRFRQIVRTLPTEYPRHVRILRTRGDYSPNMLTPILTPVPHEKRMRTVIRVTAPVHLDITRIVRKLALVLLTQRERVARLRQQPVEKLDVARVKLVIEFVVARMMEDQHAAFLQQRLVAIKVEVITERHY